MIRTFAYVHPIVAALALVTACQASCPSPAARVMPSALCRTSRLRITVTHAGAVTGDLGGYVRFTNRGPGTCRLSGWPTVTAAGAGAGRAVARQALHGMMFGAWQYRRSLPVVVLRPGVSGYAVVENGDNPVYGTTPCPHYRWLDIVPPGNVHGTRVSAWLADDDAYLPACTAFNGRPEIEVSVIVPGSDVAH